MIIFDANYGRTGTISVEREKCLGCGEEKLCLVVDQSEREYRPAKICEACASALFAAGEDKSPSGSA